MGCQNYTFDLAGIKSNYLNDFSDVMSSDEVKV